MAPRLIVAQLKNQAGLHPLGVVGRNPQLHGKVIHQPEVRVQSRLRQAVGVRAENLHGLVAPKPVQTHRQLRGKVM